MLRNISTFRSLVCVFVSAALLASYMFVGAAANADEPEITRPKFGKIIWIGESEPLKVRADIEVTGVKVGHSLQLLRDGKRIGWVTIDEMTDKSATGQLVLRPNEKVPTTGDEVLFDSALEIAKEINQVSFGAKDLAVAEVARAKKLGRLHAQADLKIDVLRVLGYGEAMMGMKDEKTGYDVHFAAGCKVSDPVVAFVDEYNEVVRLEHETRFKEKVKRIEFVQSAKGEIAKLIEPRIGAEEKPKTCQISLGAQDGLKVGSHLAVYRENLIIAHLSVKSVESRSAIATIGPFRDEVAKVGDTAFLDTTVELAGTLVKAKSDEVDAIELAKLHFESDSKLGFKRILSFGKVGASNGVRIDEKSGLPIVMAGGCIVSEPMMKFVKEYNRLMNEDAAKKK